MSNISKAFVAALVTIILWASAFIGIRYVMKEFSSGSLAFARYFIASIAMIIPFVFLKDKTMPKFSDLFGFCILGFFGFFSYNIFLNEGEITVSSGMANFIVSQLPVFVVIIAMVFFNEKVNKLGFLGFILSVLGSVIIFLGNQGSVSFNGVVLVYIAVMSAAVFTCLQKNILNVFTLLKLYHTLYGLEH